MKLSKAQMENLRDVHLWGQGDPPRYYPLDDEWQEFAALEKKGLVVYCHARQAGGLHKGYELSRSGCAALKAKEPTP